MSIFLRNLFVLTLILGATVEMVFILCPKCTTAIRNAIRRTTDKLYSYGCQPAQRSCMPIPIEKAENVRKF